MPCDNLDNSSQSSPPVSPADCDGESVERMNSGHLDDVIVLRRSQNMYRKMIMWRKISMMIDVLKEINLIKKSSGSLLDESDPPAMKEEVLEQNS